MSYPVCRGPQQTQWAPINTTVSLQLQNTRINYSPSENQTVNYVQQQQNHTKEKTPKKRIKDKVYIS